MKTIVLSEIAVIEVLKALDIASKEWMKGMDENTPLPFSNDVKLQIEKQIEKQIKEENDYYENISTF